MIVGRCSAVAMRSRAQSFAALALRAVHVNVAGRRYLSTPAVQRAQTQGVTSVHLQQFSEPQEKEARSKDRIVFKFGGSSVGNAEAIAHSCKLAFETSARGQVVVVVSAMYGVTNKLVAACDAAALCDYAQVAVIRAQVRDLHINTIDAVSAMQLGASGDPTMLNLMKREVDVILETYFDAYVAKIAQNNGAKDNWLAVVSSLGERLTVPLMAYGLSRMGLAAECVYTDKLVVTGADGEVKAKVTQERLQLQLLPMIHAGVVPVVSGFIAGLENGEITTLGRGGSDLSSTLMGNAVEATEVQLCKVECDKLPNGFMKSWSAEPEQVRWTGIRSGCPNTVSSSHMVVDMSFLEAAELAHYGKKVLHRCTMEPVQNGNTKVFIRNTALTNLGTQIGGLGDLKAARAVVVASISVQDYIKLHAKKFTNTTMGKVAATLLTKAEAMMGKLTIVSVIGANSEALDSEMLTCLRMARLNVVQVPSYFMGTKCSSSILVPATQAAEAQKLLHARFVCKKVEQQASPTFTSSLRPNFTGALLDEFGSRVLRPNPKVAYSTLRNRTSLVGRVANPFFQKDTRNFR